MRTDNKGGPAFPCEVIGVDDHGEYRLPWQGMDLRDYFAAKAMPSVYKDYAECARTTGWDEDWRMGIALGAYELADAMLKAREA